MRGLLIVTVLAIAVPVREEVAPQKEKGAKPLLEQLQGSWQMVSGIVAGQPEPAEKVAGTTLVFKGNQIFLREPHRKGEESASFTLDPAKQPAAIDIQPQQPPLQIKIEGIVKIEGDLLTLCFPHGGEGKRPTVFVSTANTRISLLQFRRLKQ